ncbi:MAG: leucine carboxyl methyltransferase [Desulfovibrio sp.]|nr:leucine carboxyl methyltransferase [Desulfovibrio sp.]
MEKGRARHGVYTASRGERITLTLLLERQGRDVLCRIFGGEAHIGACAVQFRGETVRLLQGAGHREGEIAAHAAARLGSAFDCTVAVLCGIHLEAITAEEIDWITQECRALTERALQNQDAVKMVPGER